MIDFSFKNWLGLQKEMTSCAAVGGGGSFTGDVASFARPVIGGPITRSYPKVEDDDDDKKKHHKKKI